MSCSTVIETVDKVGDKEATEVGAKRLLNGAFRETLVAFDEEALTFRYSIDGGYSPLTADAIQSYFGEARVFSVTDTNSEPSRVVGRDADSRPAPRGRARPPLGR